MDGREYEVSQNNTFNDHLIWFLTLKNFVSSTAL